MAPHTMLSTIRAHWPPRDGDPDIGHKTIQCIFTKSHTEPLVGLHEPAWWTGCRILTPASHDPFYVEIVDRVGRPLLFSQANQMNGSWVSFPWPIPAMMANRMGLSLRITSQIETPTPINVRIGFQEMTDMPVNESYLFLNHGGFPVYQWTGDEVFRDTDEFYRNRNQNRKANHHLVPVMVRLLSDTPWHDLIVRGIDTWAVCLPT